MKISKWIYKSHFFKKKNIQTLEFVCTFFLKKNKVYSAASCLFTHPHTVRGTVYMRFFFSSFLPGRLKQHGKTGGASFIPFLLLSYLTSAAAVICFLWVGQQTFANFLNISHPWSDLGNFNLCKSPVKVSTSVCQKEMQYRDKEGYSWVTAEHVVYVP